MSPTQPKIVALDIGNVCVNLKREDIFTALGYATSTKIPTQLLTATDMLEKGEMSEKQWLNEFQKATEYKFDNYQLIDAWNRMLSSQVAGMHSLLLEITKQSYRLIFFSDTSSIHLKYIYRHLPFAYLISGGIFSFETGAKKPDNKMFDTFEAKYGQPSLYLDDLENNIQAAKKRGWKSHLFHNSEDFKKEFFNHQIFSTT